MEGILVRTCAVIAALTALCASGAFALSIDFADTGKSFSSGGFSVESLLVSGFRQTNYLLIDPGTHETLNKTRAWVWDDTLLKTVASGLFVRIPGDSADKLYYVDPTTLCITAADIRCTHAYPVPAGSGFLSFDEAVCRYRAAAPPKPEPGAMFIIGVGLFGLSGFKKRNPQSMSCPEDAVPNKGNRFYPARLNAAKSPAVHGAAVVIPIGSHARKRIHSHDLLRYRIVTKRQGETVRYRAVLKRRSSIYQKRVGRRRAVSPFS